MLGKTHMAVGTAAALAVLSPESVFTAVPVMAAAAVGSVISDIDSERSIARKKADRVLNGCVLIIIGMILVKHFFQIDLFTYIRGSAKLSIQLFGCAVFALYCNIGKHTAHRSMMHSLVTAVVLSACVYYTISPMTGKAFFCGFISHLALDLLNYKGEQLFWPLPNKLCMGLCSSNQWVNQLIQAVGILLTMILFLQCFGIHIFSRFT